MPSTALGAERLKGAPLLRKAEEDAAVTRAVDQARRGDLSRDVEYDAALARQRFAKGPMFVDMPQPLPPVALLRPPSRCLPFGPVARRHPAG